MPWYSGPTLLEHLETVPIQPASSISAIRFPVQYVIRPDAAFRGYRRPSFRRDRSSRRCGYGAAITANHSRAVHRYL